MQLFYLVHDTDAGVKTAVVAAESESKVKDVVISSILSTLANFDRGIYNQKEDEFLEFLFAKQLGYDPVTTRELIEESFKRGDIAINPINIPDHETIICAAGTHE